MLPAFVFASALFVGAGEVPADKVPLVKRQVLNRVQKGNSTGKAITRVAKDLKYDEEAIWRAMGKKQPEPQAEPKHKTPDAITNPNGDNAPPLAPAPAIPRDPLQAERDNIGKAGSVAMRIEEDRFEKVTSYLVEEVVSDRKRHRLKIAFGFRTSGAPDEGFISVIVEGDPHKGYQFEALPDKQAVWILVDGQPLKKAEPAYTPQLDLKMMLIHERLEFTVPAEWLAKMAAAQKIECRVCSTEIPIDHRLGKAAGILAEMHRDKEIRRAAETYILDSSFDTRIVADVDAATQAIRKERSFGGARPTP